MTSPARRARPSGIVHVLFATLAAVLGLLVGALVYYHRQDEAEDPRVLEARVLRQAYQERLDEGAYNAALALLDAMDAIYRATPGYQRSFERGVIENDRATVHLVQVERQLLAPHQPDRATFTRSLHTALDHVERAVAIYRHWLDELGQASREGIRAHIAPTFSADDPALAGVDVDRVIQKRLDDLVLAQIETPRRLSVALTNRGVIRRYLGELELAKDDYEQAIALWSLNHTARNNLNRLMDLPPTRRPLLEQLFPPDRSVESLAESRQP